MRALCNCLFCSTFLLQDIVWKSPKMSHFNNLPNWTIFGIFNKLLFTQKVNVARFARNVEWDLVSDFQTPCPPSLIWCLHTASRGHLKRLLNVHWDYRQCCRLWLLLRCSFFMKLHLSEMHKNKFFETRILKKSMSPSRCCWPQKMALRPKSKCARVLQTETMTFRKKRSSKLVYIEIYSNWL